MSALDAGHRLSPDTLLCFLPEYGVLICKKCGYAIQPTGIPNHLKEIHGLGRKRHREIFTFALTRNLATPDEVFKKRIVRFPVELLPVIEGLGCRHSNGCRFLCASWKAMQRHWLASHGEDAAKESKFCQSTSIQTFFRGKYLRYFTQTAPASALPLQHAFDDTLDPLFAHFINATSYILIDRYGDETIWREIIPSLAVQKPFLSHAVRACAAHHQSYSSITVTERANYNALGHQHHAIALKLFRSELAKIDDTNANAILAFCLLLIINSLAADSSGAAMMLVDENSCEPEFLCSWLYFIRNGCLLLCDMWDEVLRGPLGPLASCWDVDLSDDEESQDPETSDHATLDFNKDWSSELKIVSAKEADIICREAAAELDRANRALSGSSSKAISTWDVIRIWPMQVSTSYLQLLRQNYTAALEILARYGLLLDDLNERWYMRGATDALIRTILCKLENRAVTMEEARKVKGVL